MKPLLIAAILSVGQNRERVEVLEPRTVAQENVDSSYALDRKSLQESQRTAVVQFSEEHADEIIVTDDLSLQVKLNSDGIFVSQ